MIFLIEYEKELIIITGRDKNEKYEMGGGLFTPKVGHCPSAHVQPLRFEEEDTSLFLVTRLQTFDRKTILWIGKALPRCLAKSRARFHAISVQQPL